MLFEYLLGFFSKCKKMATKLKHINKKYFKKINYIFFFI